MVKNEGKCKYLLVPTNHILSFYEKYVRSYITLYIIYHISTYITSPAQHFYEFHSNLTYFFSAVQGPVVLGIYLHWLKQ